MENELKPCPFCGGTNLTMVSCEGEHYAGCFTCHTCGPGGTSREEAIEAWNRRCNNGT